MLSFSSIAFNDPDILGYSRNTDTTTEIDNFNCSDKTPSPVASPVNSNIPMRATLNHSLWEQENPEEHFLQAPVASSLGENFLGP